MGCSTHRKRLFVPCSGVSRWTGCVGVCTFSTAIIRTGVCAPASLLHFPPRATGSKCRSSTRRKPLTPRDEITVRPTRDFLPTQEVEAQLRGKGLFLCHHPPTHPPVPALPASSSMIRVLSQDRRNASPAPLSDQAGSTARFVYITEVLSPAKVA